MNNYSHFTNFRILTNGKDYVIEGFSDKWVRLTSPDNMVLKFSSFQDAENFVNQLISEYKVVKVYDLSKK